MDTTPKPNRGNRSADAVRRPLDAVLGREANVRLLRLMATEVDEPINAEEAARRTGLTPPGVRKGFERLVRTGLVLRAGSGRSQQFVLNSDERLVQSLRELFQIEAKRYEDLLREMRAGTQGIPEITRAWIDQLPAQPGDPIQTTFVVDPRALGWVGTEIRDMLAPVERRFDYVIEARIRTEADAPEADPGTVIPLAGVVATPKGARCAEPQSHACLDRRSKKSAEGLARLIREDPSIIRRAQRHLERLVSEGRGTATGDLAEWAQVLETYAPERLQHFLVSDSERATRLRASSPFFAVLTEAERERLTELTGVPDE